MAYPILIISQNEIITRFSIQEAIDMVEQAFANHEKGNDILPNKLIFKVPGGISACMASMLPDLDVLAMKLGQGREENPKRNLPNILSQISLFDPDTGKPLALMDGSWVTGLRTGASAAVAVKHLARTDVRTLGILGAGYQGRHALRAAVQVREFEEIRVYDSFPKALESYVAELSEDLGRPVEPVRLPQDLVTKSDVIITCTNTTVPIVQKDWLRPGTHLSCMGADQAWKQELANGVHADAPSSAITSSRSATWGRSPSPWKKAISTGTISRALWARSSTARLRAVRPTTRSPCSTGPAWPFRMRPSPAASTIWRPRKSSGSGPSSDRPFYVTYCSGSSSLSTDSVQSMKNQDSALTRYNAATTTNRGL